MARRNVNEVDMNLQIKNRLSLRKVRKIATPEDIQRAGGLRQLQKLINGFHTLPIYVEKTVFDQNGRTTTGKHL
ncbi:MAG: hypothetical protein FWE79_02650, partial [Firmicutes bacterium]|nr:hypothetical protein [Bacillota bacterium]